MSRPYDGSYDGSYDDVIRAAHAINDGPAEQPSDETPTLFTVHRMEVRGSDEEAWGVRFHEGGWWPWRFKTKAEAEQGRDAVLLEWLEGECVLVGSWAETEWKE